MGDINETQRRSLETIREAIEAAVMKTPEEITADDVRRELGNVADDFAWEMMGGAFNTLKTQGLLERVGTKTSQWPGMKNRRLTTYRATVSYRRQLGLVPQEDTSKSPSPELLRNIFALAQARGFVCTLTDVVNFYLCLHAKPFVILSGISGTGKTLLPTVFAEAIAAKLHHIAVKPNWTDNSDLMGYYSIAHDEFVPGPLTQAIEKALADPGTPHFVRLDEMNLAHVEHYLSDVLSVMETRRRQPNGSVTTEPLPLELPLSVQKDSKKRDRWAALQDLVLPWNLFIIGTVNVDETTHPFSKKVLDRAHSIDFSEVDLTVFGTTNASAPSISKAPASFLAQRPASVREVYSSDAAFFDEIAQELDEVNGLLREADLHFGYRIRDEICLYLWAWKSQGLAELISRDEALDFCLMQKVLARCHGSAEVSRRALQRLFHWTAGVEDEDLDAAPDVLDERHPEGGRRLRRTSAKILRMLRRYRDTGFFSYWS